jgi:hypothetical protein
MLYKHQGPLKPTVSESTADTPDLSYLLIRPRKFREWASNEPSPREVLAYIEALKNQPYCFSIENYSATLLERVTALGRKNNSESWPLQQALFDLQSIATQAFDRFLASGISLGPRVAEKVLHASAHLGICHPLIVPALNRFHRDRSYSIANPNSDLDLLIDLGRKSNLPKLNCTEIFCKILSFYKNKFPISANTSYLHVKRLFALALASASQNPDISKIISEEISTVGAIQFNKPTDATRLAMLLAYARPQEMLPQYLQHALSDNIKNCLFDRGTAESVRDKDIRQGIFSAAQEIFPETKFIIDTSVFLPFPYGPYNCDFLLQSTSAQEEVKIALEINGQQHYCLAPDGQSLRGADVFKQEVLRRHSIRVLNIANTQIWESARDQLPNLFKSALVDEFTARPLGA